MALTSDVPVGTMRQITIDDEDIAVYHVIEAYYATSDLCTHVQESLTAGTLQGCVVGCPRHGGKFDIRTGAAVKFPCVTPLQTYAVEIRGEEIWVNV